MARSDLHALTYPKERVHQKFNYVGKENTRKKECQNPTCISVFNHLESSRA